MAKEMKLSKKDLDEENLIFLGAAAILGPTLRDDDIDAQFDERIADALNISRALRSCQQRSWADAEELRKTQSHQTYRFVREAKKYAEQSDAR